MISDLELPGLDGRPELASLRPSVAPPLSLPRRLRAWAWCHWPSIALLLVVLLVVGVAHAWGMHLSPAPSDDEGTYMAQAWAVQRRGELAHYTYWYDHPPLGWILISGWTWLTGAFDRAVGAVAAGRELMLLVHLACSALLYLLARRMGFQRTTGAAAVILFTFTPLGLSYHRMVLLDNLAMAWALAAFVLVSSPRSRLWAYAGGGACFAGALLTKETTLLLLPAVLLQLWARCDPRTRRFCMTAFLSTLVLAAVAYPLAALLKGELLPGRGHVSLFEAIRFQLFTRPSSGSVFDPTQPAHRIVSEWLDLDPWLVGVALVLALPALLSRNLRATALALVLPAVAVLRGGYLPGPFVIGLLPFAALLVAGMGDALWRRPLSRRRTSAVRRLEAVGLSPPADDHPPSKWRRVPLAVRRSLVVAAVLLAGILVGPQWAQGDNRLMTADSGAPLVQATQWVDDNVPRSSQMLVDDSLWVDLVERGFDPDLGVVWFYKLDFSANLDPSVAHRLPDGWRHFDYVVFTPVMRSALDDLPRGLAEVRSALGHSTVVASFGGREDRVEVRRVDGAETAGKASTEEVGPPAPARREWLP